jgi:hypothetical protein
MKKIDAFRNKKIEALSPDELRRGTLQEKIGFRILSPHRE